MDAITLFTLQAVIVLLGPVLWGWYVQRKTGASWKVWMWGALTFFVSQIVLRTPLLLGLTLLLQQLNLDWSADQSFWFNLVFLTLTAALFEEGGRWLMMRWRHKDILQWRDGVMFGAGHGGIEAMLLVGFASINNVVLLSMVDTILASVPAEQLSLVQSQITQLQTVTWDLIALSLWERLLAIIFHTAASLLVLKSVRERKALWWWVAFWLHVLLNGIALLVMRYSGTWQTELALTLFSVISIGVIWWSYQRRELEPLPLPSN